MGALRRRRVARRRASTPAIARGRRHPARAGLRLLGRSRQGRPRLRLPVVGVGRGAEPDRRGRATPGRAAARDPSCTSPPTTAWSTSPWTTGSTWPTTRAAAGVRHSGGEPRALQLYCEPGAAADVAADLDRAVGRTRPGCAPASEAIAEGWFGAVSAGAPRIGDVVVATAREHRGRGLAASASAAAGADRAARLADRGGDRRTPLLPCSGAGRLTWPSWSSSAARWTAASPRSPCRPITTTRRGAGAG